MKSKLFVICTLCLVVVVAIALLISNIIIIKDSVMSIHNEWDSSDIVCSEDYIFFTDYEGKIIRTTIDNKEHKSIIDDIKCFELNLNKDKLYFISEDDNFIYRCDFDGKNREKIIEQRTLWFDIYDNSIYFRDGYIEFQMEPFERGNFNLYKANLNGKRIKKITTCETVNVQFAGKDIIYWNADEEALYKTDLKGSNHTLIKNDTEYSRFIIYNGKLYYSFVNYSEDSGIYSYDFATGEKEKLVSTVAEKFTVWNDKLVYIADSNSSTAVAYISTLEGKNPKKLFNNCMNNEFAIFNDWLYFVDEHVIRCVNLYSYELKFLPKVFVEKQTPEETKGNTVKYESTDSMEYALIEYNKDGYKTKESRYDKERNDKLYDTDIFYNNNNQISNLVDYDENGMFSDWRMLYDEQGRVSKEFGYDENYRLNTYIVYNYQADGTAEKIYYDPQEYNPQGTVEEIEFDELGRPIKTTCYKGIKIEYYTLTEYNNDGKISKETKYSPDNEILCVETYTIIKGDKK